MGCSGVLEASCIFLLSWPTAPAPAPAPWDHDSITGPTPESRPRGRPRQTSKAGPGAVWLPRGPPPLGDEWSEGDPRSAIPAATAPHPPCVVGGRWEGRLAEAVTGPGSVRSRGGQEAAFANGLRLDERE